MIDSIAESRLLSSDLRMLLFLSPSREKLKVSLKSENIGARRFRGEGSRLKVRSDGTEMPEDEYRYLKVNEQLMAWSGMDSKMAKTCYHSHYNIDPHQYSSSFYNNPCLKDVQAFYAKELPISPPDPITPPAILTPSSILPPSLLFDPRYFFVLEKLLPPKKRICSPSSSSTTLSNPSWNQTRNLVSPSSSVYTPTPPQVFEKGKCSDKMYLKHHEKQVEDILNYLDELSLHRIEKMEEGRINGNKLKTELKGIRTQIIRLQKERLGQKDKIAFAHYRISDLEQIIEKIQARHQTDQEDLFVFHLPAQNQQTLRIVIALS
ncbi:hypothetical protein Tco_1327865 [Tanacetum coccineum]